jgi:maltooligosyltrehalose trehalohydrolase
MIPERRWPIGAEVTPDGVHFRVWAPGKRTCDVVLEDGGRSHALAREDGGYFAGLVAGARDGARYRFRLDGGDLLLPDPASRFQPEGPHGPSQVVDPSRFRWSDGGWRGIGRKGQVVYELHVGTFTPGGTFAALERELPYFVELGVTTLELMPVADFPGRFGWGYDGVNLFAPTRLYGQPDDLRRLVDRAHALGLAVILDVVYNHLGPDGNYLGLFGPYFAKEKSEWGDAINFGGEGSRGVRELFATNAACWIAEYHLDGLRLDAVHAIVDRSEEHILAEVARRARAAAGGRSIWIVAENESQGSYVFRPPVDLDAAWNDDFHHAARVAGTGRKEAYFSDYTGSPQELLSALRWGFLYQGQVYPWQKQRRGRPVLDVEPERFVSALLNHDQVANVSNGVPLYRLISASRMRALTAVLLLGPHTPMLFQGQEFAASARFLYFADHEPDLAAKVRQGRAEFVAQFPSAAAGDIRHRLDDPAAPATFEACRLDLGERETHREVLRLHQDLLRLRREDPIISAGGRVDGAVLGPAAFCVRWPGAEPRLLLVNLGIDLTLGGIAEPLLAPPEGTRWRILWSTEDPRYGGTGTPEPDDDERGWRVIGHAAVLLAPERRAP